MAGYRQGGRVMVDRSIAVDGEEKGKGTEMLLAPRTGWVVDPAKLAKANYYGDAGFEVGR